MKRLILIGAAVFFLMGCANSGSRSGFWQHDTMYRSWDHMGFSWFGYHNVSAQDARESQNQNWWGEDIPYVP